MERPREARELTAALMLDLDDRAAWERLCHAYGSAGDIPALLRAVESLPAYVGGDGDPYYDLWSALCHQGTIYTASYAAVPHLVRIADGAPPGYAALSLVHLAAYIEFERDGVEDPEVPPHVAEAYRAAVRELPRVTLPLLLGATDDRDARMALFVLAACAGRRDMALAIDDLSADIVEGILDGSVDEFTYSRKHGELPTPAMNITFLEENWMRIISRKPDGSRSVEYLRSQRRHE